MITLNNFEMNKTYSLIFHLGSLHIFLFLKPKEFINLFDYSFTKELNHTFLSPKSNQSIYINLKVNKERYYVDNNLRYKNTDEKVRK